MSVSQRTAENGRFFNGKRTAVRCNSADRHHSQYANFHLNFLFRLGGAPIAAYT
jgi:hypothetical protein